jgi:hypothetical protein
MAHIADQPGPVCLEGGVSCWLVGVVGLGAELHPRPHPRRVGRFCNSSGLVKRAVSGPPGLRALRPGASYGWIPHNASFGFLDRPPATLGVFASLDRF